MPFTLQLLAGAHVSVTVGRAQISALGHFSDIEIVHLKITDCCLDAI